MLRNKTSHRFLAIYWVKHLHSCCFPIHFKFKLFVSEKFQFEDASETIQHNPELIDHFVEKNNSTTIIVSYSLKMLVQI